MDFVHSRRASGSGYAAGFVAGSTPPPPGYTGPGYTPGAQPPYAINPIRIGNNDLPTGAIVLIGLGTLFLLGSLGIFHEDWIGRSWPLLIVAIGVWLIIRRTRESKPNNGGRNS